MDLRAGSLLKKVGTIGLAASLIWAGPTAQGAPKGPGPHVGDTYEISNDREMSQTTNRGSSGNSGDRDIIVERVIAVRAAGVELEYDLPKSATAQDRASNWQLPARVFKPSSGPPKLLNGPEMETRLQGWLKAARLDRAACGRLIFTWNAFRIECDPQSVLRTLEQFDLGSDDLRDGVSYRDPRARGPAPLIRKARGLDGTIFAVEMAVDPNEVRRGRAETDVGVAEITGKTLSREAALRARSADEISGTITTTFETDSTGRVRRRTTVAKVQTKRPNGEVENQTETETLERRPVAWVN